MRRALVLLLSISCQNAPKSEPAPASSAAPLPSASAVAAATPDKPWFEGSWQGTFQAELLRIELPAGGVKEWKTDDGKEASGAGELAFAVSPDGTVSGTGKGALGELVVSGRVEGDRAALSLAPAAPGGFQGVVLATRAGEGLKGTLNASRGDSLRVRRADVTLSRAVK